MFHSNCSTIRPAYEDKQDCTCQSLRACSHVGVFFFASRDEFGRFLLGSVDLRGVYYLIRTSPPAVACSRSQEVT